MDKLLRCPICGKQPKLEYEHMPTGTFVTIKCKPLFRQAHLIVREGKVNEERAKLYATNKWNKSVITYMRVITERSDEK